MPPVSRPGNTRDIRGHRPWEYSSQPQEEPPRADRPQVDPSSVQPNWPAYPQYGSGSYQQTPVLPNPYAGGSTPRQMAYNPYPPNPAMGYSSEYTYQQPSYREAPSVQEQANRPLSPSREPTFDKQFQCDICGLYFRQRPDVDRHKNSVHDGDEEYHCIVEAPNRVRGCEKVFKRRDNLRDHLFRCHKFDRHQDKELLTQYCNLGKRPRQS
jgi:uncharacterized C2H2 Zn-finger protein